MVWECAAPLGDVPAAGQGSGPGRQRASQSDKSYKSDKSNKSYRSNKSNSNFRRATLPNKSDKSNSNFRRATLPNRSDKSNKSKSNFRPDPQLPDSNSHQSEVSDHRKRIQRGQSQR